jgi:hypothetical protein
MFHHFASVPYQKPKSQRENLKNGGYMLAV